jgi:hypothetical protein
MNKTEEPVLWDKLQDAHAWTRLSISGLNRLCISEAVESVHIKKPGSKGRGYRLIKRKSLEAYLEEVLQLCRPAVIGWLDAPSGLFGLRPVQVAPV